MFNKFGNLGPRKRVDKKFVYATKKNLKLKNWKIIFEMKILVFEIWKKLGIRPEVNEKKNHFWNENFPLKFEKFVYTTRGNWKQNWYILFMPPRKIWFFLIWN
jgi:hypothetical protein